MTSEFPLENIFVGDSEMAMLMREIDWEKTPLGAVEHWSQSLRTSVSICLTSRFPILIWWGAEMVKIYNDAYRPILGAKKHPQAMGQCGKECWAEIWHIIGPMLEGVFYRGEATWSDNQMLPMDRNGYIEETYFTFSYSPIWDESKGIGGIFTAVTETTKTVIGERRLRTLRDLGAQTSIGKTVIEACQLAAQTLASNPADIPFGLIYLFDEKMQATLVCTFGFPDNASPNLALSELVGSQENETMVEALYTGDSHLINVLHEHFGALPGGVWVENAHSAVVIPIAHSGQEQPYGVLVAGISPRRAYDDDYQVFFELVARQLATSITNARTYEEERQRRLALAELDRAKTVFFSNVSHEFRTPLTLMLAPLEDSLNETGNPISIDREQFQSIYRNGLRLLKLVNTLLDFSRIEANRLQAFFEPTDLGSFTADLASMFRSAIERGDLELRVDCPSLPESAYVDHTMWEKIILNLLSNAYKFTMQGIISVELRSTEQNFELYVRDTGIGIPPHQLAHIFIRFHQVKNKWARTYEGTGIGLALVQELVKLHGGTITVQSEVDQGSTFIVCVPKGCQHLPPESVSMTSRPYSVLNANLYIEEALHWLSNEPIPSPQIIDSSPLPVMSPALDSTGTTKVKILIADDNADMRNYLHRILEPHYQVKAVGDGNTALDEIHAWKPNLVLSDVMMPGLDGFQLLQELRATPPTSTMPIILLSARAGEEARLEGLQSGADDYIVKPFSARELLARVEANLKLAQLRHALAVKEATLEERKRLARDLHDAVSQTLFSSNLIAQSLPNLVQRKPEILAENLEKLVRLNRGALAEMRMLLLELRWDENTEINLVDMLQQLAEAMMGNTHLEVRSEVILHSLPPQNIQMTLYRIAQETLNNVVKHAEAKQVLIHLEGDKDQLNFVIRDDGKGFDMTERVSSHMGLKIMRERALDIQAELQIFSTIDEGTEVTMRWQNAGIADLSVAKNY